MVSSEVIERLNLIHEKLHMTKSKAARILNITPSNYSQILNGNRSIGKIILERYNMYLNIDPKWILSGQGDLINIKINEKMENNSSYNNHDNGVPYYNTSITDDFNDNNILPEYYINFPPFNDANAYLSIFGDSMLPNYKNGDIIAIKEITNFDIILWGEPYLIVTDLSTNNLRTIKLIHVSNEGNNIILRSTNPEYSGDITIQKNNIKKLYKVIGKISRDSM